MNCNQCRKWWSPYLDSELDASTTFEVSEHLRSCPACRDRFEREKFVDELLRRKLQQVHMPDATWSELCDQVRSPQPQRDPQPQLMPWYRSQRVMALAASVLLVFSGWLIYRNLMGSGTRESSVAERPDVPVQPQVQRTSVASLLTKASPRLAAFSETPVPDAADRLEMLGRKVLATSITFDANASHHRIDLIDAEERTDDAGVHYIEVRMNCCDRPVLLALSERGQKHAISEFAEICSRCPSQGPPKPRCSNGIDTRTIEKSGVIMAAAVPHHELDGVFAAINVQRF